MEHRSLRRLDDLFRGRLTIAGRTLLVGMVGSGVLLAGGISDGLSATFGLFTSLFLLSIGASTGHRPLVSASRRLTSFASAGEIWAYEVVVTNTGSKPLYQLMVEERGLPAMLRPVEEAPVIEELLPGASASVYLKLSCLLRGEYRLDRLQVSQAWPSGLAKATREIFISDRVLVFPKFTPLDHFEVPIGRVHQPQGVPMASKVGDSTEFHSLREWRQGDRIKDVHWPTFARMQKLVVREFQEEYFARLALVVDLAAPTREDEARAEGAISMAAALVDVLARQDFLVEIVAVSSGVHRFSAGRALVSQGHILELLACLEAGDTLDLGELERSLFPDLPRLSAVLLVLTRLDGPRQEFVERLEERGVTVRVMGPFEGGTP